MSWHDDPSGGRCATETARQARCGVVELPSPAELEGASSWIVQVTSASDAAFVLPLVASLARNSVSLKNVVVMVGTAAVGTLDDTSTMAGVEAGWEAVVEASKGGDAFRCTMLVVDGIYDGSDGGGRLPCRYSLRRQRLRPQPPLLSQEDIHQARLSPPSALPGPGLHVRPGPCRIRVRDRRGGVALDAHWQGRVRPSPPSCCHRHRHRHGHRDHLKPCPLPPTIRPCPRPLQPLPPRPRPLQLLPPRPRPLQPLHTRATDTDAAAAFTVISPPRGGSICLRQ